MDSSVTNALTILWIKTLASISALKGLFEGLFQIKTNPWGFNIWKWLSSCWKKKSGLYIYFFFFYLSECITNFPTAVFRVLPTYQNKFCALRLHSNARLENGVLRLLSGILIFRTSFGMVLFVKLLLSWTPFVWIFCFCFSPHSHVSISFWGFKSSCSHDVDWLSNSFNISSVNTFFAWNSAYRFPCELNLNIVGTVSFSKNVFVWYPLTQPKGNLKNKNRNKYEHHLYLSDWLDAKLCNEQL